MFNEDNPIVKNTRKLVISVVKTVINLHTPKIYLTKSYCTFYLVLHFTFTQLQLLVTVLVMIYLIILD